MVFKNLVGKKPERIVQDTIDGLVSDSAHHTVNVRLEGERGKQHYSIVVPSRFPREVLVEQMGIGPDKIGMEKRGGLLAYSVPKDVMETQLAERQGVTLPPQGAGQPAR